MSRPIQSAEEQLAFEAYVRALLSEGDNEEIFQSIAELEVPRPYRVRLKVLYSPDTPEKVLLKDASSGDGLKRLSDSPASFSYEETIGRKYRRTINAPFFLSSFPEDETSDQVAALVAVATSEQWRVLTRFARRTYPRLVPILLSQAELIRGVKILRQVTAHTMRVRAFSARESVPGERPRQQRTVREWTDEDLDQALLSIQERRQILTSLDVEFFPRMGELHHVRPKASCKIRKTGEVEVSGSFKLAFSTVALQIAKAGEEKLNFLSGRGLRDSSYQPRALSIEFSTPILEDVEVVKGFVSAITKYPRSMHAVEHGNPFAHVQVTDMFDGSSFNIWAIPPERIILVPGLRASEAGFERIVHYIFESFREGKMHDYGRRYFSA